jgi:adenosylcobinamide kinase / adenosylcobinamide-phosphate guanylyltransferase
MSNKGSEPGKPDHAISRVVYDLPAVRNRQRHMTGRSILVLGGARSGKSRFAESLAAGFAGEKIYLATAQPGDEEMAARIAAHRGRRGPEWSTVEAPVALVEALEKTVADFVLIDCLTLWISNLLLAGTEVAPCIERLAETMRAQAGTVVVVSNEVGLGIVPDNALARRFRDDAGLANQCLAQACDEVVFVAAGLPLKLKP